MRYRIYALVLVLSILFIIAPGQNAVADPGDPAAVLSCPELARDVVNDATYLIYCSGGFEGPLSTNQDEPQPPPPSEPAMSHVTATASIGPASLDQPSFTTDPSQEPDVGTRFPPKLIDMAPVPPSPIPPVEPPPTTQTHQRPQDVHSVYLGNNVCRYYGSRFWGDAGSGDYNTGVDNSLGVYTRARATVPFFGGSGESAALALVGVRKYLPRSWPSGSTITVYFPWHTQGLLDSSADLKARGYAAHRMGLEFYRGGERTWHYYLTDTADANGGNFGDTARRVVDDSAVWVAYDMYSPAGQTYRALIYDWGYAYASGGFFNKARGTEQFWGRDLHSWLPYQDWQFGMPPGHYVGGCGR